VYKGGGKFSAAFTGYYAGKKGERDFYGKKSEGIFDRYQEWQTPFGRDAACF